MALDPFSRPGSIDNASYDMGRATESFARIGAEQRADVAEQRADALEQRYIDEAAARAVNRAHIAALKAVIRRVAQTNPDVVRRAIEAEFDAAFAQRATEVGLPRLYRDGEQAIGIKGAAHKLSTIKDCLER